jgi:hypothetical protein
VADLHGLVAQLALVLAVIGAAWVLILALTRREAGSMVLGLLVWVIGTIVVAGLLGVMVALTIAPPGDALHILYGLLAAATLPGAALVARDRPPRQQVVVLAIALVIEVILVVRLFQTGG